MWDETHHGVVGGRVALSPSLRCMALLQVSPAFRVIACGDLPELKPQGSRFTDFKGKRFKQKGFLNLRPSKPGMSGNWIDDEALETAYIGL